MKKGAGIIKSRLKYIPHYNGGPTVIQSELLLGAEKPEYYRQA